MHKSAASLSNSADNAIIPIHWEDAESRVVEMWRWEDHKGYKRDHKYVPLIAALDIETSTAPDRSCAWMYLWCFAITNGLPPDRGGSTLIVYGRTLDDLRRWLDRLIHLLDLRVDYRLLTYIHNAKYDLGFLRKSVSLAGRKDNDFIARSQRQIIKCCMQYCLEIRDSAVYTEMPLEMMGVQIGLPKLSEDHNLIRTPDTPLTVDDLKYCGRDVHILTTYFAWQASLYSGMSALNDIPLTATSRVRRIIAQCFTAQQAVYSNKDIARIIQSKQLVTQWHGKKEPTPAQKQQIERNRVIMAMLRSAFFGGFCYASPEHSGHVYHNCVASADIDACYAWAMVTQKYPVDDFRPLPIPETEDEELQMRYGTGAYTNYALLIQVRLYGVKAAVEELGIIPSWLRYVKQHDALKHNKNGSRVKEADMLELILTDIDYELITRFYEIDQVEILSVFGSRYGVLPPYIFDTIFTLYDSKKTAKAEIKQKRDDGSVTLQDEVFYQVKKTMLARLYGVFVQDPIRMHWYFDDNTHTVVSGGLEQAETDRFNKVLYQWGVWVAAHARRRLLDTMIMLGAPEDTDGYPEWDFSVIYADTDCVRFLIHGEDDPKLQMLREENERMRTEMIKKVREYARRYEQIYHVPIEDTLLERCGSWDIEIYQIYKHIGIKQYVCVDEHGKFKATIAGLPKADYREDDDGETVNVGMRYFDRFDTIEDKVAALSEDMIISCDDSRILRSKYFDDRHELDVVDCTGVLRHVVTDCGIVLEPTPYKVKKTTKELISSILEADAIGECTRLGIDFYKLAREQNPFLDIDMSYFTESIDSAAYTDDIPGSD